MTIGKAQPRIDPVLWLRSGAAGEILRAEEAGYAVNGHYGVLVDSGKVSRFTEEVKEHNPSVLFVVTDSDSTFSAVAGEFTDKDIINSTAAYLRSCEEARYKKF